MTSARLLRPSVASILLLSLAACGGGGGGGGSPSPNPPGPASRTIGGTVAGLAGSGLVLQNNGGDNLAVNANGSFTFATSITQGNAYNVTVLTQPSNPQQACVVTSGSGNAGDANVTTVAVACSTTASFTVTANVTGLTGAGLIIANGSDRATANTNGSFTFDTRVASGNRYNVVIDSAPTDPAQRCTIANGNGAIANANVTVAITCAATFPTLAYNLNQDDGTLASYAIDASSGQMRPRFVAKTGARPTQLTTYIAANGKRFSYIANQDSDTVSAFALDPRSGAMTEVPGSPFAAGDKPTTLALHPSRAFIYAINETGASIVAYAINTDTGALTSAAPVTIGSTPRGFSIDASGRFAYAVASGSGELFTYSIDQTTGALTEVPNSRATIGTSFGGLALERNGRFVYSFNSAAGTISAFAINATTGVPTQITGSPFAGGTNVALLGVHPNGRFIYARRGPQTQDTANGVAAFAINETTGALSEIAGSPFDTSANPLAIAFDPTGRNMYAGHLLVQDTPEFNVRAYSVNSSTGALTAITGSPFASPAFPASLDVDSTGKYLYVANTQSNQLTAYGIDKSDGSLSQLAGSPINVGVTPTVVAAEEDTTPLTLSSKFVYVTDPAGSVRSFNIATDGTLSAGASVTATTPLGITLDPQGRYAYVADSSASAVRIYAVNGSTGALTETSGSPISLGGNPQYVAIEPSGRYAYVSIPSTTSIVKLNVDANTGALSSPVPKTVTGAQDLAVTPNGRWLLGTSADASTLYSYTIDAGTGDLGAEVAVDLGVNVTIASIAVDLSGKFAYVTDTANRTLRQFQINAQTGALSPVGVPLTYGTGRVPVGIAVDPKGGFAFTADSTGDSVSMFSINSTTGALTYRSSIAAGTNPMAITADYSGNFVRVATASGELLTFSIDRGARSLTLVDTETGGGATAAPGTIVSSSHAE